MEINIVLLLATLFSITSQTPPDQRCLPKLNITWQTYKVDHFCPTLRELVSSNPEFHIHYFERETCLCEGYYKGLPSTRYHSGPYICDKPSSASQPNYIEHFLGCLQFAYPLANNYIYLMHYKLSLPTRYDMVIPDEFCESWHVLMDGPLIQTKYSSLLPALTTHPNCNYDVRERIKQAEQKARLELERKRWRGEQKNLPNVLLQPRHKKGHR